MLTVINTLSMYMYMYMYMYIVISLLFWNK